jgi:hypothetical protein
LALAIEATLLDAEKGNINLKSMKAEKAECKHAT